MTDEAIKYGHAAAAGKGTKGIATSANIVATHKMSAVVDSGSSATLISAFQLA